MLSCLERFLLAPPSFSDAQANQIHDVWLGDFNRHDPMWESPDNPQLFTAANLDEAGVLINLLANFEINIALELGIPTLEHLVIKNLHQVDHVFCLLSLLPCFVRCEVLPHENPPKMDHFPIISTLDLTMICTKEDPK